MNVEKHISPLIASQFPAFYETEGPNFVAFVKAYYEWMELQGNVIEITRSLYEIKDLDTTPEQFIQYFKNKYISSLPYTIITDQKLLVKHILDLYRTKGTKRSYELLFRLLFNEDIEFVVPGDFIFKPSDATWHIPKYIEVSYHPLLKELIGKKIYSRVDGFATVENYFVKVIKNKTVNVLILTGIEGNIQYGEQIFCDDFPDEMTIDETAKEPGDKITKAPYVLGSLSSVSITNGGANFKVGQLLEINAGGEGGSARVVSTRSENGKVIFTLIDGGQGYTMDSIVEVQGGNGSDASFEIGGLTNKRIYYIVRDKILDYKDVAMDDVAQGSELTLFYDSTVYEEMVNGVLTSHWGFENNQTLETQYWSLNMDVTDNYGLIQTAQVGEVFSNSTEGVTGLIAYRVDGSSISFTGEYADLTNFHLVNGIVLTSNITGAKIKVNNIHKLKEIKSTANVREAAPTDSGYKEIDNEIKIIIDRIRVTDAPSTVTPGGYFAPYTKMTIFKNKTVGSDTSVKDDTKFKECFIKNSRRITDWLFPKALNLELLSNLDTPIGKLLTTKILETGTISYITNINPGDGYSSDPKVTIVEPDIYDLRIKDRYGRYYGYNANSSAVASTAAGIVTAVNVVDSGYGYNPEQNLDLRSMEGNKSISVSGVAVVDSIGKGLGYYKNNKGFLSDTINIQDSYYYQNYSYEIVASRMKNTYETYVKDLIHPSGIMLFGKFSLTRELLDRSIEAKHFARIQIVNFTIDSDIKISANSITSPVDPNLTIPLTIDKSTFVKNTYPITN
jgi:hypothetical protein